MFIRFIVCSALLLSLAACQSTPKSKTTNPHPDILFHKIALHHQKMISSWSKKADISYEDAAFRMNRNHHKEVQRVVRCAREQDGFEQRAIYQIPPRYELHFYFKGDAAAKLAKCTHDPLFIAHNVKYGLDDLKAVYEEAKSILSANGITDYSEYTLIGHSLSYEKPYPDTVLSEDAYIKIGVDKQNLERAREILKPLMLRHEFLFIVEGFPNEEVFVESTG